MEHCRSIAEEISKLEMSGQERTSFSGSYVDRSIMSERFLQYVEMTLSVGAVPQRLVGV